MDCAVVREATRLFCTNETPRPFTTEQYRKVAKVVTKVTTTSESNTRRRERGRNTDRKKEGTRMMTREGPPQNRKHSKPSSTGTGRDPEVRSTSVTGTPWTGQHGIWRRDWGRPLPKDPLWDKGTSTGRRGSTSVRLYPFPNLGKPFYLEKTFILKKINYTLFVDCRWENRF